jgi:hypothetical protein
MITLVCDSIDALIVSDSLFSSANCFTLNDANLRAMATKHRS